jgi:hypothetical protein
MHNTWCFHKMSQMPVYDNFWVIYDEMESSWISRFFVMGTDTTKTFTGKIESQDDLNGDSLSLWSSLYNLPILCSIMWSWWSITQLVVVGRVICLQCDHSFEDSSAVPSYNFSSGDTRNHCKLATSCLVYALGSSRTTPLVEEVLRHDMIHFSQIPMSWAGVSHQWGNFWREMSIGVWSDMTFNYLPRRKGWIPETFLWNHRDIAR